MNERLVILAVAGAGALWAMRNWREALKVVLVLLLVEGAIRKWLFPGSHQLIYFGKDILLLGVYAGFVRSGAYAAYRSLSLPLVTPLLVAGAAWGAFQIFNPNLPTPLVGVLGFKAYFMYAPLLFVVPVAFRDGAAIYGFLRRYLLLSIPLGLVAALQFVSPGTATINSYGRGGEDAYAITFGSSEHVRVTSTFSFITGYSSYLIAVSVLFLAVLGASRWRIEGNVRLYGGLALTLLGMLMTGSRGPVFTLAFLLPLFWWFAIMREGDSGATAGRFVLAATVLALLVGTFGARPLDAFLGRASNTSDVANRLGTPFVAPLQALEHSGLLGVGIGASHQAAASVASTIVPYSWLGGVLIEAESGRVMQELGLPGFLFVYGLRFALVLGALQAIYALRRREYRALAVAAFLFLLNGLIGSPVFDPTSGVYYWFFAGLIGLATRLDRLASVAPAAAAAAATPRPQPRLPAPVSRGVSWRGHRSRSW